MKLLKKIASVVINPEYPVANINSTSIALQWENGEKSVIVTINGENCEYNTLRRAITLNKH